MKCWYVMASLCLVCGVVHAEEKTMESGKTACEIAEKSKQPKGAPRLSDVSMRLFVKRKDESE